MSKADRNNEAGQFKFSIDSSLLFQLGEQLVAKPSIALAELVKNAYDADATEVTVSLENIGQPGGTITIVDNGHGMVFEEVRDHWMRIASAAKRKQVVSRIYNRPLTGAKGIGRFAARRLGNQLRLVSTANRRRNAKERVSAVFDWAQFSSGKDLASIPVTYTREQVPNDTLTGVTLIIENARDAWNEEEIVDLRRDLLSLQSPFPDLIIKPKKSKGKTDPGFNFELQISGAKDLDALSGGLGSAFLAAGWAKLDGVVDPKGRAHYKIRLLRSEERDNFKDNTNLYSGLAGAKFRIYFFVYSTQLAKGTNFSVRELSQKGREEGGVRIYLDGFRVFPYGSQSDDWLRLDEYAVRNVDMATVISPPDQVLELANSLSGRPYLLIPRNRQLFGAVAVSQSKHSNIEMNISRERLLETATVTLLRQFVQNGIYWMTLKYAAVLAEEKEKQRKAKPAKTAKEVIVEAKSTVESLPNIPDAQRVSIAATLDQAIQLVEEEAEERISEISMLRLLASAGTTLSLMNHQLQALIESVSQSEADLIRLRTAIPKKSLDKYDDIINQIAEWHEMIKLQVSQLGFLLAPDKRQRRKRHPLYQLVENAKKPMTYYINQHGIRFENNVPKTLRTPSMFQAELYSVLINIFSNALKAVYGQPQRAIAVEANKVDKTLFLWMKDTGIGVPVERRESAFRPFVSTSLPNPILGVGTGLGLKVVRDTLESYGGTARFVDPESPWKTCIEIVLPDSGADNDN